MQRIVTLSTEVGCSFSWKHTAEKSGSLIGWLSGKPLMLWVLQASTPHYTPLFTIYFILFIILLLYSFAPLSSWKDSSSFFLHIHMSMILSLFLIRKKHMTKQPQLYNCSQIYDLNFVAANGGKKTI